MAAATSSLLTDTPWVRSLGRLELTISTEGSLSARVGPDAFLFTPFGKDRRSLTPSNP